MQKNVLKYFAGYKNSYIFVLTKKIDMTQPRKQTTPDDVFYCDFCMMYVPSPCFTALQAKRCQE